ncbi:hypothetical protein [Longimicrobium sp.]|uniref:hypothetical protein n=1 Tax=Longimicrobium sp. TaxID=2029185 RepID=UPI002CC96678|nr:hypothetical protein [Longimicrobium sp.]HSU16310.1 hypothetical protein [Longimicrobium sp.]
MTTLAEARESYYTLSGKASDAVRQLGFAGIAVIWVFKSETRGAVSVPDALLLPGLLTVAGLFLDLLQYVFATVLWSTFIRRRERAGTLPGDLITAPPSINWPANTCFYLKIALILAAYVGIGLYLRGLVAR